MKTPALVARDALVQEVVSLVAVVAMATVAQRLAHLLCKIAN